MPSKNETRTTIRRLSERVDNIASCFLNKNIVAKFSDSGFQFMDLGDVWIRYKIVGTCGPVIVLSTDPPNTIEAYEETAQHLSHRFRVVLLEYPGFGFSMPKRLSFRYDFNSITRYVLTFLENLGLGPYVLSLPCVLGFSAISIANQRPELVSHMVLIQQANWQGMLDWKKIVDPKRVLQTPILGQLLSRLKEEQIILNWFEFTTFDHSQRSLLAEKALSSHQQSSRFCMASCFQCYLNGIKPKHIDSIKQPTLIIWGMDDKSHKYTDKTITRRFSPTANEVFLKGVGHSPELEKPEVFSRAVHELVFKIA